MQKITSIINNQQGSVIIMAVMILALLTVIGISATNTSTTEVQVSTNAVLHNIAFYTADSGIAAGRAALNNLKIADAGSWDHLLFNLDAADEDKNSIKWNGVDCVPNLCWTLNDILDAGGGRTVGPATFTLAIEDNIDLDGNDEVDSDDTIFLTSTLVSPYRNATATIRTTVRGGGEAYAQEHYNASSSGEAGMESEEVNTDGGPRWD
jgi:hypothetical protein